MKRKIRQLSKYLATLLAMMLIAGYAFGQNITVTGVVTSTEDGLPIPGATVVEVGTSNGVTTGLDGNYSITVQSGASLEFAFLGMQSQTIAVNGRTTIDVALEPELIGMGEVVVTSLGITREKKSLGYSVTEVDGDELTVGTSVSPVNVLQGKATGVLITNTDGGVFGGTRITIRGNSTLGSNNQPIYIVDGVIIDNETSGGSQWGGSDWGNNLKNLNPDDFESVSILKGAAATALYGSRAINGVILITTKKGRERRGIGLEITHTTALESVYDGHDFQDVFGWGYIAGYASWYSPDAFDVMNYFPTNVAGEWDFREISSSYSWGPKFNGQPIRDYDGTWTTYDAQPTNYLDAFQLGVQNNTNIALSGGSEKSNYRVSYSFKDHNGVYPRNATRRNSVSANFGHELTKGLRLDMSIAYVTSDNSNPPNRSMMQNFITWDWSRAFNTEKWYKEYQAPHGGTHLQSNGDPYWQVPSLGLWYSIFENSSVRTEDNTRVRGNVTANITDWLTFKFGGTYNIYTTREEVKQPGQGYQNSGGYYSLMHTKKYQQSLDAQLIFNRDLMEDLNMNLILGGEQFYNINSGGRNWTNGGLIPPLMYSLAASNNTPGSDAWVNGEYELYSAFYILNFDYKGQFFLDLTGRNDWTSTMVYRDGSGKYSYFYPSFTGSWVFSETFDLPEMIDFGKLRLAYAIVGTSPGPYNITTPFTYSKGGPLNTPNGEVPYYSFSSSEVPNPDLQPEKKHEFEVGLDVRMFHDRLGIDFTYYNNHTFNQILSIPVPSMTGVGSIKINAGDIQNKGLELTLHTTPVRASSLEWDLDFNFTRNRNMIVELYGDIQRYGLYESGTYGNTRIGTYAIVGGEWGVLMSDSNPQIDEETGLPILVWSGGSRGARMTREGELERVGSMNPDFFGSINSVLTFKNLSLNVLIDGKIGGYVSTYSGRYGACAGLFDGTLEGRDEEHGGVTWTSSWTGNTYHDGVIPDGVFAPETTIQMKDSEGNTVSYDVSGMTYQEAVDAGMAEPTHASYWGYFNNSWSAGVINENVLSKASYISLREVAVGYMLPRELSSKIGAQNIRVSVYGRNLTYLYNAMTNHLHPEAQTSNNAGAAHEWGQIPYTRTIGFKLNLNF